MRKLMLQLCERMARERIKAHHDSFKHFSFIVQDNELLGYGFNKGTYASFRIPGYPKYSKIHSEMSAIKRAGTLRIRRPWTMVNLRFNRFGEYRDSFPCPSCLHNLQILNCREIYYSTRSGICRVSL